MAIKRHLYVILVSNRTLGHKIPHFVFMVSNLHSCTNSHINAMTNTMIGIIFIATVSEYVCSAQKQRVRVIFVDRCIVMKVVKRGHVYVCAREADRTRTTPKFTKPNRRGCDVVLRRQGDRGLVRMGTEELLYAG